MEVLKKLWSEGGTNSASFRDGKFLHNKNGEKSIAYQNRQDEFSFFIS